MPRTRGQGGATLAVAQPTCLLCLHPTSRTAVPPLPPRLQKWTYAPLPAKIASVLASSVPLVVVFGVLYQQAVGGGKEGGIGLKEALVKIHCILNRMPGTNMWVGALRPGAYAPLAGLRAAGTHIVRRALTLRIALGSHAHQQKAAGGLGCRVGARAPWVLGLPGAAALRHPTGAVPGSVAFGVSAADHDDLHAHMFA